MIIAIVIVFSHKLVEWGKKLELCSNMNSKLRESRQGNNWSSCTFLSSKSQCQHYSDKNYERDNLCLTGSSARVSFFHFSLSPSSLSSSLFLPWYTFSFHTWRSFAEKRGGGRSQKGSGLFSLNWSRRLNRGNKILWCLLSRNLFSNLWLGTQKSSTFKRKEKFFLLRKERRHEKEVGTRQRVRESNLM